MKLVSHGPKLVAATLALVALASGILAHVDPIACVCRAILGYVLGKACYQIWYGFFACHISAQSLTVVDGGKDAETASKSKAA